ncbi:MAG: EAL domain-containing protein [Lachnospiraceae bacterium]|nr:EAL domain-containing protein [Lachnospiraceae bacterium]
MELSFMQSTELYIDYAGAVLLIILGIMYRVRKSSILKTGKLYFALIIFVLLQISGDINSHLFLSKGEFPNYSLYAVRMISLLIYPLLNLCYTEYIKLLTANENTGRKLILLLRVFFVVLAGLIVSSPLTHLVFSVDRNGVYSTGPCYYLLYCFGFYNIILNIYILLKYKNLFSKNDYFAVNCSLIIDFVFIVGQLLLPNILIISFGNGLMLMILYTSLENPDKFINEEVECYNYKGFLSKLDNMDNIHSNSVILLFGVAERDHLNTMLSRTLLFEVNKELGQRIKSVMGKNNVFYLGNGSFASVAHDTPYESAESVLKKIDEGIQLENSKIFLFSYACFLPCERYKKTEWIRKAIDIFENKSAVDLIDNKISPITAEQLSLVKMEEDTVHAILDALEHDRLDVYYQTIYSNEGNRHVGAEALVRMITEDGQVISPASFIPLAEKHGLIISIGEKVLEKVCRFASENNLKERGVDFIDVNLSSLQCMQSDLYDKFNAILKKYNIDHNYINLELNETACINDHKIMKNNITKMNKGGFNFAMDDFGIGYANVINMIKLPMRFVKLDISLVRSALESEDGKIILKSIVSLINGLGYESVAEGVENKESYDMLLELGCKYFQGYLFSKPVPGAEFIAFIDKNAYAG